MLLSRTFDRLDNVIEMLILRKARSCAQPGARTATTTVTRRAIVILLR